MYYAGGAGLEYSAPPKMVALRHKNLVLANSSGRSKDADLCKSFAGSVVM